VLGATPQVGLNAMFCIESRRANQQALAFHGSLQEFLGKRRALIRQPGFLADQRQLALEALPPQRVDGLNSRLAGTHDDDVIEHGRGA
jgi:hypothetical protein